VAREPGSHRRVQQLVLNPRPHSNAPVQEATDARGVRGVLGIVWYPQHMTADQRRERIVKERLQQSGLPTRELRPEWTTVGLPTRRAGCCYPEPKRIALTTPNWLTSWVVAVGG
jgi:hypothetical protein